MQTKTSIRRFFDIGMQKENATLQTSIVNSGVWLQWSTKTFYHLKSCPLTPTEFIELNSYWLSTVSLLYNSLLLSSFFTLQTQKLPMQIFLETRISSLTLNESLFKLFFGFINTRYCEIFQWTECVSVLFKQTHSNVNILRTYWADKLYTYLMSRLCSTEAKGNRNLWEISCCIAN